MDEARRRPRVLVVDDEGPIREVLRDYLELLECDAVEAASAAEARALLEASSFDLILTDFAMPGEDGLQVARLARRVRPMVPVVILSGFATDAVANRRIREGGFTFVTKPVGFDAFQVVIEQALGEQLSR